MRLDNNDLETLPSSIGEIVSTIANLIVWWWHRFPHDSSAISMTLPRYTDSPHLKDLHRFPNWKQATIKEINCKGNNDLVTVPLDMKDRTDMMLWCLQLLCHYQDKLRRKTEAYNDVTVRVRRSEETRILVQEMWTERNNELHPLRTLIRDSAVHVRRKAEFIKIGKRVKKALQLLLSISCEKKQSNMSTSGRNT